MMRKRSLGKNTNQLSLVFAKRMFMLGIALMVAATSFAQITPPTDDGGGDGPGDPDAPIDGGISLLVAAGVAYGAKQWYNARKDHDSETAEIGEK